MARARLSDPVESKLAALSISPESVTAVQAGIIFLLSQRAMTDEELVYEYQAAMAINQVQLSSPSGIRTRRAELSERGQLSQSGHKNTLSGRRARIWAVAA